MPTENLQGGPCEPFSVHIKHLGQSNRIREHAGNLISEARRLWGGGFTFG